jgi:succinoglycan biosynthesis transport protein ExoP
LTHIGEMPEQQSADLQILGQLQSQLQLEGDELSRAEQSKLVLQTMLSQSAPVVDLDDGQSKGPKAGEVKPGEPSPQARINTQLRNDKARLATLLSHYTPDHPDVKKLKNQIEREEAAEAALAAADAAKPVAAPTEAAPQAPPPLPPARATAPPPVNHVNPVIQSQLNTLEVEIAKHREESQRLTKQVAVFQAKLSAIPVREQEITQLVRDYEISKAHYSQLLGQQLSAETATQLEIRQKGEKFEVLDPGQVAERPSRPNRALINSAGAIGGLILGILLAVGTELLGMSITSPEDLSAATGVPVLEVIPLILTRVDRRSRTRRRLLTSASAIATIVAVCLILFYRNQF